MMFAFLVTCFVDIVRKDTPYEYKQQTNAALERIDSEIENLKQEIELLKKPKKSFWIFWLDIFLVKSTMLCMRKKKVQKNNAIKFKT